MINRQEVKRMLREGLTGQEAGRLVLLDSVEVDHGRPGLLTSKELERIKRSLLPEEASVYNAIVYAYQLTGYSLLEAKAHYLEARLNLERMISLSSLQEFRVMIQTSKGLEAPDGPWTKKQIEDIGISLSLKIVEEAIPLAPDQAKSHLKALRAYQQALEELSLLLDVPLTEDFGPWWEELERLIVRYNRSRKLIKAKDPEEKLKEVHSLSEIRLSMLKADPDLLDYMRDRIAMALGENWWEEAGHGE